MLNICSEDLWRSTSRLLFNSWGTGWSDLGGLFLFWVSWIAGLTNRELQFAIGIILGTIPSGFPVFEVIVPGLSWNGSGTCPFFRVQKIFVEFGQSTKNTWLRLAKLLWHIFSNPDFDFLWNLSDVLSRHPRNERVLRLAFPSTFLCFLWNSCKLSLVH